VDRDQWLHFEILGPEIDRRLVGTHEVLGHLLERRRTEGAHVKMHTIDPADHQQWSILYIVVGVMMGDKDRTKGREWNPALSILPSDAEAAIEDIGGTIAQHHV